MSRERFPAARSRARTAGGVAVRALTREGVMRVSRVIHMAGLLASEPGARRFAEDWQG